MDDAPVQESIQTDKGVIKTTWIMWLKRLKSTVSLNELQNLPVYANNAAAVAGGLAAGKPYRTATGQVMVVYS